MHWSLQIFKAKQICYNRPMTATAVHFDTLGAAEEMEAAGVPHEQAKAISLIVDRSRDNGKLAMEMATMRADFKDEIAAVRAELKDVRAELKEEIAVLKTSVRQLFWISGIQAAALIGILLKLW